MKRKRRLGLKDRDGRELYEGDGVEWHGHKFDLIYCNGAFKMMERESGFSGAVDIWLHSLFEYCHCGKRMDAIVKKDFEEEK